jgi:hypothetical protein
VISAAAIAAAGSARLDQATQSLAARLSWLDGDASAAADAGYRFSCRLVWMISSIVLNAVAAEL